MRDEMIAGFIFGLFSGATLVHYFGVTDEIRNANAECEATLPRNQTCEVVITAKPKED